MYRYGFELEGFYNPTSGITAPPKGYPVDGFPGLVEVRTYGHHSLKGAFTDLLTTIMYSITPSLVRFDICEHKFSPQEKRDLRKTHSWTKQQVDIRNIYGKKPRALNNKTIASFQISVSNLVRSAWTSKDGVTHSDEFGLLDVPRIVQALDKEFASEIKASGRQPGEYCIKGNRLEYRSLPNSVFPIANGGFNIADTKAFLERIRRAVENDPVIEDFDDNDNNES